MARTRNLSLFLFPAACVFLIATLRSQELHYTTGVVNVEVPVRVFDGDRFVDDLTINDFEVLENGKPQRIVGLYFVRKTNIRKEETPGPTAPVAGTLAPKTGRTIVLEFEVLDPMPKLDEAIDYFFNQVIEPGDSLTVITPRATYRFKPEALARLPRPVIADQLKGRLRKDILAGAMEFKILLGEIKDLLLDMGGMSGATMYQSPDPNRDQKVMMINEVVRQLRDRIGIDPAAMRRMAEKLKPLEGQKYIFLFYEKELISDISSLFGYFGDESLPPEERYLADMAAMEINRSTEVTPKDIERMFSDASVTAHFIYLTQSKMNAAGRDVEEQMRSGMPLKDMSSPIFSVFQDIARITGGITEASGNPFAAFRKAVTATENYYLIYYSPADYRADGKFKEIKVSIKGKNYRVSNRAGYFAN